MRDPTAVPRADASTGTSDGDPPRLAGAGRVWRDISFFGIICLALLSPWILGLLTPRQPASTTSSPPIRVLSVTPRPPRDTVERAVVAAAQQGLREVFEMRDSSAPPAVFDGQQIRVDHPRPDVWIATGMVSVAWQLLMAEPHLYRVEVYQICHLADVGCFKVRGVSVDGDVILATGSEKITKP